jgi:phosphatidate cytidylyltransferase
MELLKRTAVAIVFIPVLLMIFYCGETPLLIFLTLLSVLGMLEIRDMMLLKGIKLSRLLIPMNAIFLLVASLLHGPELYFAFLLLFLFILSRDLFFNRLEGSIIRSSVSIFAVLYTGLLPAAIFRVSLMDRGPKLLILILVACWITDTFAYFIGMSLGKHRNIFQASPKKSLEGFIGGFLLCIVILLTFRYLERQFFNTLQILAAGVAAGIFGQLGDLFESMLKRDVGIKDSSNLIPGHGGILDRFDSVLLAIPVFYFLLTLLDRIFI